jgi:hypothetical protein
VICLKKNLESAGPVIPEAQRSETRPARIHFRKPAIPAKVGEKVDAFFVRLAVRAAEVMQRCRRELQGQADQLRLIASRASVETNHVDLTLRSF